MQSARRRIAICTMTQVAGLVEIGFIDPKLLKTIAMDEADLLLLFGVEEDVNALLIDFPLTGQLLVTCAEISKEVVHVFRVMNRPARIELNEKEHALAKVETVADTNGVAVEVADDPRTKASTDIDVEDFVDS